MSRTPATTKHRGRRPFAHRFGSNLPQQDPVVWVFRPDRPTASPSATFARPSLASYVGTIPDVVLVFKPQAPAIPGTNFARPSQATYVQEV